MFHIRVISRKCDTTRRANIQLWLTSLFADSIAFVDAVEEDSPVKWLERGEWGCRQSHRQVLRTLHAELPHSYDGFVVIFEDDAIPCTTTIGATLRLVLSSTEFPFVTLSGGFNHAAFKEMFASTTIVQLDKKPSVAHVYTNVPTLSTTAYAVRRAYLPHLIHMYELHDAWPVPIDWMWGMNTSTVLWKQHVPLFEDPVGRCLANVPEERMPSLPVSSSISHTVAYADRVQALLQDPRFRKPLLFTCRIKNFSDKSSMFSSVQQTVTDLNQQTLQSRDWLAVLFVNDEYTFRPSCPNADRLLMIYGMLLNVPIWADHIALVPLDDINDFIRYLLSGGSFESYKWHRSPFRFFTTTAQSSSM